MTELLIKQSLEQPNQLALDERRVILDDRAGLGKGGHRPQRGRERRARAASPDAGRDPQRPRAHRRAAPELLRHCRAGALAGLRVGRANTASGSWKETPPATGQPPRPIFSRTCMRRRPCGCRRPSRCWGWWSISTCWARRCANISRACALQRH